LNLLLVLLTFAFVMWSKFRSFSQNSYKYLWGFRSTFSELINRFSEHIPWITGGAMKASTVDSESAHSRGNLSNLHLTSRAINIVCSRTFQIINSKLKCNFTFSPVIHFTGFAKKK
jgi:hypothetical protein